MIDKVTDPHASLQTRRAIAGLQALDELPGILADCIGSLDGPPARLAAIIERSACLSAGLIRQAIGEGIDLIQSGYSIRQILERMGQQRIERWILSIRAFRPAIKASNVPSRADLLLHSLAVAHSARRLAEACHDGPSPDLTYLTGLLHDIGKLATQQVMPRAFVAICQQAQQLGQPLYLAEKDQLDTDHAVLGRLLAIQWSLPQVMAEAIWLHHSPHAQVCQDPLLARLIVVSDILVGSMGLGRSGSFDDVELTDQMARWLDLDLDLLHAVCRHIGQIWPQLEEAMAGQDTRWDALSELTRSRACRLASVSERLSEQQRQADANAGQLRLIKELVGAVADAHGPLALAARCAGIWQHHYQTARTCLVLAPLRVSDPVQIAIIGDLGGCAEQLVEDRAAAQLVREYASRPFTAYLADELLEQLQDWLDDQWAPGRTYWVPLALENVGIGLLIFEVNYPIDPDRFADQVESSAGIISRLVSLATTCQYHQQLAERLAAIRSDGPRQMASSRPDIYQALAEVASGLAHEMNNPLAVISGRAQLLAETASDEQVQKACQQIHQQAQELAALLEGLMAYAEPPQPHRHKVTVDQILEEALALTRQKLASQTLDIVLDGPGKELLLEVDSAQLASALANTIVNAFQSYQDQPGQVRIRIQRQADALSICVIDQGMGMDAQTCAKATLPFFSARPAGRQTGLGLAFAERLISINGGQLRISSQPGQGTTVEIELPLALQDRS
ncbi:MAG: HDOD domain-containing protein [Sedimentisphaerales bacterium]|nr:HDOD domain-containing protein [Sedimentisphaerales bacterium]